MPLTLVVRPALPGSFPRQHPILNADGLNGLIVSSLFEAGERLPELLTIDRAACRRHVEQRFSLDAMIDGYLNVYDQILSETLD